MLNTNKWFDTPKERELIEETIKLLSHTNQRDSLIIEVAYKTGMRESEITRLTKSDLELLEGGVPSLRVREASKDSNPRRIVISQDFFSRLVQYSKTISTDKLFPICTSRIRQIWLKNRPVKKKFHAFRHTYAKLIYEKTKNIQWVQQDLGHKAISSTMIYAVVVPTPEEKLKAAL